MKKKSKTIPYLVRTPEELSEEFSEAVEIECMRGIQPWLLETARRRVKQLKAALETGAFITSGGAIKPLQDFEPADIPSRATIILTNCERLAAEYLCDLPRQDELRPKLVRWLISAYQSDEGRAEEVITIANRAGAAVAEPVIQFVKG